MGCYIVPIMFWFRSNVNVNRNLRLLQSEVMFAQPEEHIARILCWVQMDKNSADCDNEWRNGARKWDNNRQWRASDKKGEVVELSEQLIGEIKNELSVCTLALGDFLQSNE